MPRIFVAVPLPPAIAAILASLVPDARALRRVDPALLHFTLAFVGSVPEERIDEIASVVRAAVGPIRAFPVALDAIGQLPLRGTPRVVFAGTTDKAAASRIVELGAAVRAGLGRQNIPFDAKPLLPHVTLARIRDGTSPSDARDIARRLTGTRVPPGQVFTAEAVHVMESVLGPKGPRYTSRAEAALV